MKDTIPATYGGRGWRPRARSHLEEMRQGVIWHRCGCASESAPLVEVVLAWPDLNISGVRNPDELLFLEFPETDGLYSEAQSIGEFYISQGITVNWIRPALFPPNFLFQRDLFFMTPEGAILARPSSEQRASEARFMAQALTELGIPIIASPRGTAVFEGADALWLDERTVLIGVGLRTNEFGARFLSRVLGEMSVDVIVMPLPERVQHLVGVVNFVDTNLAAVRSDRATDSY